jgi:hypothetical protein
MPLPRDDYRWEDSTMWDSYIKFVQDWRNEKRGYVLEVDLHIPNDKHDILDDLPLAPEKTQPLKDEFTDFMHQQCTNGYRPTEKLLLTHHPKKRYVVHFALLLYYVKLGAQVIHVHRCISFVQEAFFSSYIEFNSGQRALAQNEFEKDFYKLKNNSLYGKTVEDVRKRRDVRLCNTEEKLLRYTSKATFHGARRFSPNIVGVHMLRQNVLLNKPVAIGQAVLDISKLEMYQLRYNHLQHFANKFGGAIEIAGGDTESFFLEISFS